jgi:hypothetical protein
MDNNTLVEGIYHGCNEGYCVFEEILRNSGIQLMERGGQGYNECTNCPYKRSFEEMLSKGLLSHENALRVYCVAALKSRESVKKGEDVGWDVGWKAWTREMDGKLEECIGKEEITPDEIIKYVLEE